MTRGKRYIIALCVIAVAAIGAASAVDFAPKLVWNASASAPIGLYGIENHEPEIGDLVLISPSGKAAKLIAERAYLPLDIPLIKRVAALPGDEICREKVSVFINGMKVADAQETDSFGREMPTWSGCFALQTDEIFLLNDHEMSLDGRYFGATGLQDVIGVARPVWILEARNDW